jgi:hypothetical protein
MSFFKVVAVVPLFVFVVLLYVIMAFVLPEGALELGAKHLFEMQLPSEAVWKPSWSGIFIMFGVVILYFEVVKSTKTNTLASIEHVFSIGVFILALMLFLLYKPTGTSTFLIITLMSLLDVVAGLSISIAAARRDFNMGSN